METSWNTTLWQQFGAAIDMLENAMLACPAQLSLYLGQHAIPDEALDWVPRAKDEPGSQ